jgi:PAS domain S-box-containing protein
MRGLEAGHIESKMARTDEEYGGFDRATPLLVGRLRLGLGLILITNLLFGAADLQLGGKQVAILWALKSVVIAGVVLAFRDLRKAASREHVERLALAIIALTAAGSAVSGLIVRDAVTIAIVAVLIALAAATLIPWGPGRQMVVVGIVGSAVIACALGMHGELPAVVGYPAVTLTVGLAISVFVSREMERFRNAIGMERQERERTAEAFAASEARYRELIENANEAIFTHDLDGHFTSLNRATEEITGYRRDELLRMNVVDFLSPDDVEQVRGRLARLREGGDDLAEDAAPTVAERRIVTRKGRKVVLEVGAQVLYRDGKPVGMEGVARDITQRKEAELALRESETRLRQVASQLPGIVYQLRLDPDGTFSFPLVIDSPYLQQFGVTAEQVRADPTAAFGRIVAEDQERVWTAVASMSSADRAPAVEFRAGTDSGAVKWFRGSATVQELPDGSFVSTGLIIDITDRKLAEEAAVQLAAIVESSDDAIIGLGLDGVIQSWNAGAERIYGYNAAEVRGRPLSLLVPPDRPDEVSEILARIAHGERIEHFETVRLRKNGTRIDVSLTVSPVKDGSGRIVGTSSIARDMSDRIKMEAELRRARDQLELRVEERTKELLQSNVLLRQEIAERQRAEEDLRRARRGAWETSKRLNAVLQTVSEGIISTDSDGTIVMLNREIEKMWGYEQDELISRNIDVLMPERYRSTHRGALGRYTQTGIVRSLGRRQELEGLRKDGSVFPLELCVAETRVGERQLFTAAVRDISKRKQTESALQTAKEAAEGASRAKSVFLANVSHEIRTPMNAVVGMTNLLLDMELSREQAECVQTIRSASATMLALINDLLDSSKVEAGRMDLETEPFDLASCIEDAFDLVAPKAAEKDLDIGYLLEPDVPDVVAGDVARVRQVLVNLLSNAVRFTESGEVVVSVAARPVTGAEESGDGEGVGHEPCPSDSQEWELHFSVRDTGIGIPEDRFDRIFKSFSQVDSSTTRRYGGTGLGLSICRRLSELMGGRIWVDSEVGKGSTFHFTIRAHSVPDTPRSAFRGTQPLLAGRHVLIVEPHTTHGRMLAQHVEGWGMRARPTASAVAALDWIRRGDPFDVALLDTGITDPAVSALVAEVRSGSTGKTMPLVLVTSLGRHHEGPVEGIGKWGALTAPTVTRPVRTKDLYGVLVRIFAGAPAGGEGDRRQRRLTSRLAERLPLRILVAEDNEVNQQVAVRILARMGYRADVAADGVEVIQALRRQPYDLVLMDVQMPVMDGLEATRRIVELWPEHERPRIVAMTAHASKRDRDQCLASGMQDYISKPVEIEDLVAALERCAPVAATTEAVPSTPMTEAGGVPGDAAGSIDRAVLAKLAIGQGDDEPDMVADLIEIFLRHAPQTLAKLRDGIERGDHEAVNQAAHRFKSGCAQLGAGLLSGLCAEIEERARDGMPQNGKDLVGRIEEEFGRVRTALEAEREARLGGGETANVAAPESGG